MRINITLDCTDLARLARFWSAVLGFPAEVVVPGAYVALEGFTAMINVAGDVPVDGSVEASRALRAA